MIIAKIKFGILYYTVFRSGSVNIFASVFDVLNDVRQNVAVVLLFLYSIIPNLDAIIRVRVQLCETSMLLFVSVCCYAKPRCYYSCPYAVSMRNLDAIIRVRMLSVCETSMLLFVLRIKVGTHDGTSPCD